MKIFEIKIYPFSRKTFENKIKNTREKFYATHSDKSKQSNDDFYSEFYGSKSQFEDYSIGHLDICFDGCCLCYEAHIMMRRKYATKNERQRIIDSLDDNLYPDYEMKENEALRLAGYSMVPYIPKLFTEKKHYTSSRHINGVYTNIQGLNNHEIANAIKKEIERINQRETFQKLYFDMTLFKEKRHERINKRRN